MPQMTRQLRWLSPPNADEPVHFFTPFIVEACWQAFRAFRGENLADGGRRDLID